MVNIWFTQWYPLCVDTTITLDFVKETVQMRSTLSQMIFHASNDTVYLYIK